MIICLLDNTSIACIIDKSYILCWDGLCVRFDNLKQRHSVEWLRRYEKETFGVKVLQCQLLMRAWNIHLLHPEDRILPIVIFY